MGAGGTVLGRHLRGIPGALRVRSVLLGATEIRSISERVVPPMTTGLDLNHDEPSPTAPRQANPEAEAIEISIVMPCFNEEVALPLCIAEALEALDEMGISGEVVVVDNGSTDRSVEVALASGARVVRERSRGYGNACRRGLAEASGRFLVLGDADGTYDFRTLRDFVRPLLEGADMVIGSRLAGSIETGAMPWLHRRIGNPFLTSTMNLLFATGVSDAHCGLRSITRASYLRLSLGSPGMEFASEVLIEATRCGLTIEEVPIRYRRRLGGEPKLRALRDGWRHLRLMVVEADLSSRLRSAWLSPTEAARPSGEARSEAGSGV